VRVLPLIERAEDHDGTVAVGRLDDARHAVHVVRAKTAVAIERRVDSSRVSREAALKAER
jgi:hypothetical protein